MKKHLAHVVAAALLAGCSAMTTIDSTNKQPIDVTIQQKSLGKTPVQVDLRTTTFGQYEFRAVRVSDGKALYGILPLKFNGGYLAANILLFAPASFFNLREVYAQYEFDVDNRKIRYRASESEAWVEYAVTQEEFERGRKYFEGKL